MEVPENIKENIRAVLLSKTDGSGILVSTFLRDYKSCIHKPLMFKDLGYQDLGQLLKTLTDVCRLEYSDREMAYKIYGISKPNTFVSSFVKKAEGAGCRPDERGDASKPGRERRDKSSKSDDVVTPTCDLTEKWLPSNRGLFTMCFPKKFSAGLTTKEAIATKFAQAGEVVEISIIPRITFVRYREEKAAKKAYELWNESIGLKRADEKVTRTKSDQEKSDTDGQGSQNKRGPRNDRQRDDRPKDDRRNNKNNYGGGKWNQESAPKTAIRSMLDVDDSDDNWDEPQAESDTRQVKVKSENQNQPSVMNGIPTAMGNNNPQNVATGSSRHSSGSGGNQSQNRPSVKHNEGSSRHNSGSGGNQSQNRPSVKHNESSGNRSSDISQRSESRTQKTENRGKRMGTGRNGRQYDNRDTVNQTSAGDGITDGGVARKNRDTSNTESHSKRGNCVQVYIGNWPHEAKKSDLVELIKGYSYSSVRIMNNAKSSNYSKKCYAFVDMLSAEEAQQMMEQLHNFIYMDRQLKVGLGTNSTFNDQVDESMNGLSLQETSHSAHMSAWNQSRQDRHDNRREDDSPPPLEMIPSPPLLERTSPGRPPALEPHTQSRSLLGNPPALEPHTQPRSLLGNPPALEPHTQSRSLLGNPPSLEPHTQSRSLIGNPPALERQRQQPRGPPLLEHHSPNQRHGKPRSLLGDPQALEPLAHAQHRHSQHTVYDRNAVDPESLYNEPRGSVNGAMGGLHEPITKAVLFVSNFPYGTTKEDIIELFVAFGVVEVKMMNQLVQKRTTYAYVTVVDMQHATDAILSLDQILYRSRKLTVALVPDTGSYSESASVNDKTQNITSTVGDATFSKLSPIGANQSQIEHTAPGSHRSNLTWNDRNFHRLTELLRYFSRINTKLLDEDYQDHCIGMTMKIMVTHVENEKFFWAQIIEDSINGRNNNLDRLQEISMSLQDKQPKDSQIKTLGRSCAQYNGRWYRAWCLSDTLKKGVEHGDVFFIDYGNKALVPKCEVRLTQSYLWNIPPMAKPFKLKVPNLDLPDLMDKVLLVQLHEVGIPAMNFVSTVTIDAVL